MTFAEINRKYTEIISAYLANGYVINAGTMGGSQGEITKVDLTNGQHILRVLIKRGFCTDDSCWLDTLEIVVGVAEPAVLPNKGSSRYDTVWNDKLTILREDRFYKVGTVRRGLDAGEPFYGTKAEAEAAQKKSFGRYTLKQHNTTRGFFTEAAREIGTQYIRRKLGIKRVDKSALDVFRTGISDYTPGRSDYMVIYRGKSYKLH
jgi:hypothetical protein